MLHDQRDYNQTKEFSEAKEMDCLDRTFLVGLLLIIIMTVISSLFILYAILPSEGV